MISEKTEKSIIRTARFFDTRKVGDSGALGFRRSTDLAKLSDCMKGLVAAGIIDVGKTSFLDLGCADGRVNILMSYLTRVSAGIEIDEWTLEEYEPLRAELDRVLTSEGLERPSENIFLFHGNALDQSVQMKIAEHTGLFFADFDLFYTYLLLLDECAAMIAEKAKSGALFMVYGLSDVIPGYAGLELIHEPLYCDSIAIYRKP